MKNFRIAAGLLSVLLILVSSFHTMAQENQINVYTYVYVEPEHMGQFMERMEKYWYKVAEDATNDNLLFWAMLTKVDGFDIPNSSNLLFISTFKDLDLMDQTFKPERVFPDGNMEEMNVTHMVSVKHRLFVRSENWVISEGVNPDDDYKYISMSYHNTDSPAELVALENEHWGPFVKDAMDNGKTPQKAWGNATIIAPSHPEMNASTISFELWPSLNDFMGPWFSEGTTVPEDGLAKIMELEKGHRMQYVYKIQHVVEAPQPN